MYSGGESRQQERMLQGTAIGRKLCCVKVVFLRINAGNVDDYIESGDEGGVTNPLDRWVVV